MHLASHSYWKGRSVKWMRKRLTEPNSKLVGDAMGMDVEDDADGAADSGMMVAMTAPRITVATLCVFRPTYSCLDTVQNSFRTVRPCPRHYKVTDANANTLTHQTLPGLGPQASGPVNLEETEFGRGCRNIYATSPCVVPHSLRRQSLCAVGALNDKPGGRGADAAA